MLANHMRHLEGLLKTQSDEPNPQNFWISSSGMGSKNVHFYKFLGDVDAAGLGSTLWETLLYWNITFNN